MTPLRPLPALSGLLAAATLVAAAPTSYAAAETARDAARRDTCLPIPGLPCLPDPPGGTAITATTPASITGTPKVDQALTAVAPTWSNPAATTTYQWLRAGTPIDGATAGTYVVQPADVGRALTVEATGAFPLATSGTSTSDPVTGQLGDAATATAAPSIGGNGVVGGELSATTGTWTSDGELTYAYQWYRSAGGTKVTKLAGATRRTYVPKVADAGRKLAVVVTAQRAGHAAGAAASKPTAIARLTSSTTLKAPARRVPVGRPVVVRVTLKGQGGTPAGKVTVLDGTRRLATVTIAASDRGALDVDLTGLKAGVHRLSARYAGTTAYAGSASKVTTVTVTR